MCRLNSEVIIPGGAMQLLEAIQEFTHSSRLGGGGGGFVC